MTRMAAWLHLPQHSLPASNKAHTVYRSRCLQAYTAWKMLRRAVLSPGNCPYLDKGLISVCQGVLRLSLAERWAKAWYRRATRCLRKMLTTKRHGGPITFSIALSRLASNLQMPHKHKHCRLIQQLKQSAKNKPTVSIRRGFVFVRRCYCMQIFQKSHNL